MNFDRMKKIAKSQNVTIKNLATSVGLSEVGFHSSIKSNSFRVSVLEDCAKVLGVTPCDFFDCSPVPGGAGDFKDKYFNLLERYNNLLESHNSITKHSL